MLRAYQPRSGAASIDAFILAGRLSRSLIVNSICSFGRLMSWALATAITSLARDSISLRLLVLFRQSPSGSLVKQFTPAKVQIITNFCHSSVSIFSGIGASILAFSHATLNSVNRSDLRLSNSPMRRVCIVPKCSIAPGDVIRALIFATAPNTVFPQGSL